MTHPQTCLACQRDSVAGSRWCRACAELWPVPIREAAEWGFPVDASTADGGAGDVQDAISPRFFIVAANGSNTYKFYSAIIDSDDWVRVFAIGKPAHAIARRHILHCGRYPD